MIQSIQNNPPPSVVPVFSLTRKKTKFGNSEKPKQTYSMHNTSEPEFVHFSPPTKGGTILELKNVEEKQQHIKVVDFWKEMKKENYDIGAGGMYAVNCIREDGSSTFSVIDTAINELTTNEKKKGDLLFLKNFSKLQNEEQSEILDYVNDHFLNVEGRTAENAAVVILS